jgi:hypothetical protein
MPPKMKAILERAARDGKAEMLAASFDSQRPDRIVWKDRRWEWEGLVSDNGNFETPSGIDQEGRDRWFMPACAGSPAMFNRSPNAGSLYWLGVRDKDGNWLDGRKTFKLTVPLAVPAKLFWSDTVYDPETRSEIVTNRHQAALRSSPGRAGLPTSTSMDRKDRRSTDRGSQAISSKYSSRSVRQYEVHLLTVPLPLSRIRWGGRFCRFMVR